MVDRLRRALCDWIRRTCGEPPPAPPGSGPAPATAPPPVRLPEREPPARRVARPMAPVVAAYVPGLARPDGPGPDALARALEALPGWSAMAERYGGTRALAPQPAFTATPGLDALIARAAKNAEQAGVRGYEPLVPHRYVLLPVPQGTGRPTVDAYCQLRADLQRVGASAYLQLPTRPAAGSGAYAGPGQPGGGIGATGLASAHTGRAATGAGQVLVDVERGWIAYSPQMTRLPPIATAVESGNLADMAHGTAVASILLGAPGDPAIPGLAPAVRFVAAPCAALAGSTLPVAAVADAILAAGVHLLEAPTGTGVILLQQQTGEYLPLETDPYVYAAIRTVSAAGHLVIQPAGNAGVDLDTVSGFHFDAVGALVARPLDAPLRDPRDANAVVVGATCSGQPGSPGVLGQPHPESNTGALVDTWAWGDAIAALGATIDAGGVPVAVPSPVAFGGTSGAAAIVAGAAVLLQQLRAEAPGQAPLQPAQLRTLLRDPALATGFAGPPAVRIPDLARLKAHLAL